jgi:hypothetical protein
MKFSYNIFVLFTASLFTACTTDVNINLDEASPELVVDGAITTDTMAHSIVLKKTASYFSNQAAEGVSGALVTLSDGQSTITLTETNASRGIYQTPADYFGLAGRTYTLTIDSVDINNDGANERYTASCPLNSVTHIDSINVKKERVFQKDMWALKASMQEPANETNYYLMRSYKNDKVVSDSIQEWGIMSDNLTNGKYMINETLMYFSKDKKDEELQDGDKITLELCGITKDYMYFIQEAQDEFWGRNPLFGGQPSNIRTNIKQVLPANAKTSPHGYFAAYSVTRSTTRYGGL